MTVAEGVVPGFSDIDLRTLGDQFGTPLYVVSLDRLRDNAAALATSLKPAAVQLLYSLKTNYLPAVITTLAAEGLGVDVVSGYELRTALDCGLPGERIVFNGPVKTEEELAEAVRHGVFVNIDGVEEIPVLARLAARRGREPLPVGLRAYPPHNVFAEPGGPVERALPSKFGWPIADGAADEVAEKIMAEPALRLTGVHCHLGSQIVRTGNLLAALDALCAWAARLRTRTELTVLNIGGGFGVDGIHRIPGAVASLSEVRAGGQADPSAQRPRFDLDLFAQGLTETLRRHHLGDLAVFAEPGRALVSAAGVLLTRMVGEKDLGDHRWILLDGGLNLLPTAGVAEAHSFTALVSDSGRLRPCLVGGPLCYEGDVFGVDIDLPETLEVGDYVAVQDAGAYGFSRATSFNRLRPATVTVSGRTAELAWRAETHEDLMSPAVPIRAARSTVQRGRAL
ncbi:diaminopimelate decarboxylase family protein [Actinomadura sp. 1N219]|uniref:diaminopimelate decarboxylase family protein n=1 Tax=Actinomadura sp. 1N219 TaxID=3375152 RepID=UPI0037B99FF4